MSSPQFIKNIGNTEAGKSIPRALLKVPSVLMCCSPIVSVRQRARSAIAHPDGASAKRAPEHTSPEDSRAERRRCCVGHPRVDGMAAT